MVIETRPASPQLFPPTKEEIRAANAGEYAPRGVQRLMLDVINNWMVRLGLAGTGVYFAYQQVPAVYEGVNSLAVSTAEWWNSFSAPFDSNKNIKVAPLGIPEFPPSVPSEHITPTTTGKSPQELAKEAGYNILWREPNDNTGRTVFYDWRGGWGGGIEEKYNEQKGTDGKIYRSLVFLTGQFVRFENIESSEDKYIVLKDPKTGALFQKIRVDFEGKIVTTEGMRPTGLGIENISFNQDKARSLGVNGRLGYVPQWSETQLAKMLQPGDAVGIGVTAVKGISANVLHEEDNVVTATYEPYFAGSIGLRRFGGKAQIEKELASP